MTFDAALTPPPPVKPNTGATHFRLHVPNPDGTLGARLTKPGQDGVEVFEWSVSEHFTHSFLSSFGPGEYIAVFMREEPDTHKRQPRGRSSMWRIRPPGGAEPPPPPPPPPVATLVAPAAPPPAPLLPAGFDALIAVNDLLDQRARRAIEADRAFTETMFTRFAQVTMPQQAAAATTDRLAHALEALAQSQAQMQRQMGEAVSQLNGAVTTIAARLQALEEQELEEEDDDGDGDGDDGFDLDAPLDQELTRQAKRALVQHGPGLLEAAIAQLQKTATPAPAPAPAQVSAPAETPPALPSAS